LTQAPPSTRSSATGAPPAATASRLIALQQRGALERDALERGARDVRHACCRA
jgi:hypothetical protein